MSVTVTRRERVQKCVNFADVIRISPLVNRLLLCVSFHAFLTGGIRQIAWAWHYGTEEEEEEVVAA